MCVDDLSTGSVDNIAHLMGNDFFELLVHDVCSGLPVSGQVDGVLHFASAASPPAYLARPLETLAAGSDGTRQGLELATGHGARFLLASTSEVYGDPHVHPQPETYWGNVNPIGPRSVYDEAKRYAEALTMAWGRAKGTDVAIVRIFNTYGPRLHPGDGRVVSNFLVQAISGQPLTVYGDGSQTRSLCFVDDEVAGILALFDSGETGPLNIGNPDEITVLDLAHAVVELTGSPSKIVHQPRPVDDPTRRCPDITQARTLLKWEPQVDLSSGLQATAAYFREGGRVRSGHGDETWKQ